MVALAAVMASPRLEACASCFGRTDSPLAHGMNAGILSLLVVIGTLLGLIASFFVFICRRAARIQDPAMDGFPSQSDSVSSQS